LTANSVAKLALGIADNQALTVLCECVATAPLIIFPRINAAHTRQPAWNDHLDWLRSVGVELIYGEHVWPLAEPRTAGPANCPGPQSSARSNRTAEFGSYRICLRLPNIGGP
jgi:hypothetical protein